MKAGLSVEQERSAPDGEMYVPTTRAAGCPYCFDPESGALRRALRQRRPDAETALPTDRLADDIGWLHRLLRAQYAGYIDWIRHPHLDVEAFFADWVNGLRRVGRLCSFREAVVDPLISLRSAVPDRHLTFWGADPLIDDHEGMAFHEYQAVVDDASDVPKLEPTDVPGARPGTWQVRPVLHSGGRIGRIASLSACTDRGSLVANHKDGCLRLRRRPPTPPRPRPAQVPVYEWRACGDVTVVTLRSFGGPRQVQDHLRQFVADYVHHVARPSVLLDLRGNNGGNLTYIAQWIAQAKGGESRGVPRLEVALWACAEWNRTVEAQVREGRVDHPEAQTEREHAWAAWLARPLTHTLQLSAAICRGKSDRPYSGRVFALVDRNSGSSGERAAVDLKRELGAILVGERTAGCMQYGEAVRFVLPQTGLVVQVPTRRFFFDEDVECVGFPVDVYLEDITQSPDDLLPHLDAIERAAHSAQSERRLE